MTSWKIRLKSKNEDEKRKVKRSCILSVRVVLKIYSMKPTHKNNVMHCKKYRMKDLEQMKEKRIRSEKN